MKERTEKIMKIVMVLIILIGMILLFTKGLKFDLRYEQAQKIEVNLGKKFEVKDVEQITKEVFGDQATLIQKVEVYEEGLSVTAKEITEEQKVDFVTKINEKYGTEMKAENVVIDTVPKTRGRDVIKPYIIPLSIATIIILAYMGIRYHKLSTIRTITRTLGTVILFQIVLLSFLSMTRMPIGRITISIVLTVFLLSFVLCTTVFEKELKEKNDKEQIQDNKK